MYEVEEARTERAFSKAASAVSAACNSGMSL
jgi:hypothetical protein